MGKKRKHEQIRAINRNFAENGLIMGVPELKNELHDFISHADERFLKMVYAMSREYQKSTVVGYNTDGSPITHQHLAERVKAASKRVKSGDFITQDEVIREMETW